MSLVGRVNLTKMIFMPQLLYILHNTPTVVPFKIFPVINSLFSAFLWLNKPLRIRLEQLQKPKEAGDWPSPICDSTTWLPSYNILPKPSLEGLEREGGSEDPTKALLKHGHGA